MTRALVFGRDGTVTAIHNDSLQPIVAAVGRPTLRRASNVEPLECLSPDALAIVTTEYPDLAVHGSWWADLRPSGGKIEGPFKGRQPAIDFEIDWLTKNVLNLSPETGAETK